MARPTLGEWEVEFLRVTAFTSEAIPPTYGDEIWKSVIGAEAEEVTRKAPLGMYSASGPSDGGTVSLNISPGRVDWLYGPANIEDVLAHSLGAFADHDVRFSERLLSWLQFPKVAVNRLAFGQILRLPAANRSAAYRMLGEFLPRIAPDPEFARDFMYQINRPREAKSVPGLSLNRLAKWASMVINAEIAGTGRSFSSKDFVRLELDLSTDKDSQKDLSKDKGLCLVLRELIDSAREIAMEGDV
jgi:hypothetical protein